MTTPEQREAIETAEDTEMSRYYCPISQYYFLLAELPSDLCCPECGTALEYDDPLERKLEGL